MKTKIEIHNLAVLRAAVEGLHLGTYFGSWGALQHWIESTVALGLLDGEKRPTQAGIEMAHHLSLTDLPTGRAYLWPRASELESKAQSALY